MNKKIVCVLLVVCVLTLTGCHKRALSNNTFIMKIDELGFKKQNRDVKESTGIKSITSAISDANWEIVFYVFEDEKKAQEKFREFKMTFPDDYLTNDDGFYESQENYEKCSATYGGKFKYASRIGATLIEAEVDEIHKTNAKNFIESLNY